MEVPRLPGVVTDLIQALLLLTPTEPPKGDLKKVVAYLEGQLARGTVDMDARVEYPEIYYENESGRYSLHQVSSMVSEIAAIVLFLKYVVRPGQLLIIEEPESHLDVDNQRKLARALASIVRAGVKVLITTHSDYFVNQINNLLLLSQLSPRQRRTRGYSAGEVLDPNDVGAYLFCPGDQGSSVEDLKITPDEGIPTKVFTDAHSALYNEAITLEHLVAAKAYGVPAP
jgi:predicted ATPase